MKLKKAKINLNNEFAPLRKIAKKTKTLIHTIAVALAFIFTWLEFHDLSLIPLFTDTFSNIFFKIILAFFYLSWVIGASKDIEDEEYVLLVAPNKGKLAISGIMTILTLGALFTCLCIFNTYKSFVIALSGFFIFNVISWLYLKLFLKKAINESINKYKMNDDLYGLLKIKAIEDFLWGEWQINRFILGFFLLFIV